MEDMDTREEEVLIATMKKPASGPGADDPAPEVIAETAEKLRRSRKKPTPEEAVVVKPRHAWTP